METKTLEKHIEHTAVSLQDTVSISEVPDGSIVLLIGGQDSGCLAVRVSAMCYQKFFGNYKAWDTHTVRLLKSGDAFSVVVR